MPQKQQAPDIALEVLPSGKIGVNLSAQDESSGIKGDESEEILYDAATSGAQNNVVGWAGDDDPENPYNWPFSGRLM
jgi:hypothetical protein